MPDLTDLLTRVREATRHDSWLDQEILEVFGIGYYDYTRTFYEYRSDNPSVLDMGKPFYQDAVTRSTDDALALAERLLPNHRFALFTDGQGRGPCCLVMIDDEPVAAQEFGATLPLAILAALLVTLQAKK